jgi:hypothetical protein
LKELLSRYHLPDPTWEIWNINNHDEFIEKFMVKGKFHQKVPAEIIKEYAVVERLICYSYYYYPIIDEAFAKLTRLFESAVKLRLNELGLIDNGRHGNLIDKLRKLKPYTTDQAYQKLNKVREIRNVFAHPEANQFFGIAIHKAFISIINLLNILFLDKSILELNDSSYDQLKKEAKHLKDDLCVFNFNSKKYLVLSVVPGVFYKSDSISKTLWILKPVLNDFPQNPVQANFVEPFFLRLKDLVIDNEGIKGIDLVSGQSIEVTKTNNKADIEKYKNYKRKFSSANQEVKNSYDMMSNIQLSMQIMYFYYEECWF